MLRVPRVRRPEGLPYDQANPHRAPVGCVGWDRAKRQDRQKADIVWKVSLDEIKARNYILDCKNPHTVEDDHGDPEELLEKLNAVEQWNCTHIVSSCVRMIIEEVNAEFRIWALIICTPEELMEISA